MGDSELADDQQNQFDDEQSLAETPLTPVVETMQTLLVRTAKVLTLASAASTAFSLLTALALPCCGATRSTKLRWQERQLEIQQAEQDAQSHTQHND
jgi:hypothetical protein